jgi:hypothetical protein
MVSVVCVVPRTLTTMLPQRALISRAKQGALDPSRPEIIGIHRQDRAKQIRKRTCTGDECVRPSTQALQFSQIDTVAVYAKTENKQRYEETCQHNAPSDIFGMSQRLLAQIARFHRSCGGRSALAPPGHSDVDCFHDRKFVVDLDALVTDGGGASCPPHSRPRARHLLDILRQRLPAAALVREEQRRCR